VFVNSRKCLMNLFTRSLLVTSQLPCFETLLMSFSLSLRSMGQSYIRWSTVWFPPSVWSYDPESYAGSSVCYWLGPPMPDRSRVMTQTKRNSLAFQVRGWASGYQPHNVKKYCYETSRGGQGPPRAVEPMMMTVC